ncbi:MAG: hypothetical protein QM708_05855 [Propioniciclava sp.]|uniref:hypothetical protein n=1 Tax=Propioniciclava sp. TaxID=2038686 RepID=UPI0039E4594C
MSQPTPAPPAGPAGPGADGSPAPGLAPATASAPRWTPPPREALDFPVFYDPAPAVAWWRGHRRVMIGRIIGLGISAVIWGVIAWFNRDNLDTVFWVILSVSLAITLVTLVVAIVRTVRAKRAVKRLNEGLALGIGRGGLHLDTYLAWEDVDHLVAVPGGGRGSGRLIVVARNGAWRELPIDWLSHAPSAVDGAVRALSGNRFRIDLDPLDA